MPVFHIPVDSQMLHRLLGAVGTVFPNGRAILTDVLWRELNPATTRLELIYRRPHCPNLLSAQDMYGTFDHAGLLRQLRAIDEPAPDHVLSRNA